MDKLGILFVYSLTICFTNAKKECPPERLNLERSWEAKLGNDLDYNQKKHYHKYNRTSEIDLDFIVTYFRLSESLQIFTMFSVIIFNWKDECLKWEPSKYGNVTKISMSAPSIGLPTLRTISPPNQESFDRDFFFTTCVVQYHGKVKCAPRIRHDFVCDTQVKKWPFDVQECTLKFSSDIEDYGRKIKYNFSDERYIYAMEKERFGWSILDSKIGEELVSVTNTTSGLATSKQKALYITMRIERVGKGLEIIIICPLLISMALTLISLMPIIENCHRFGVICFSILCQLNGLNQISYHIPEASLDAPTIIIFSRGSFVISVIQFFVIYVLDSVRVRTNAPPSWLLFINTKVLNTPFRHVLQLSSSESINLVKVTEHEGEDKNKYKFLSEWQSIANIGVIFFFTLFSTVYLVLALVCIPVEANDV